MASIQPLPHGLQRIEPWANGAGNTRVIWREPDNPQWRIRISVANVDIEGPFSELPDTRRILVPLDAPMTLHFADGRELQGGRMRALRFEGAPAPAGLLPQGPTRDFNLMLRDDARGDVFARTLVDSMLLPPEADARWLVYLDSGRASIRLATEPALDLAPRDAALVVNDTADRALIEGAGEIVLAKLYA